MLGWAVHSSLGDCIGQDFYRQNALTLTEPTLSSFQWPFFPGEPGLAGLLELRMMEVVVTTGAISRAKIQSNRHHQQTAELFYRPDALPVAQPTVSKHVTNTKGEKFNFHRHA